MGPLTQVAHNSFVSVLVEEGIVGLLLYLTMQGYVFFSILRLPRLERRFALVLFGTLIVAMLPLTWEDEKAAWLVMAMLMGLSYASYARPAVQAAFTRTPANLRRAPAPAHLRQRMPMPGPRIRPDGSS
jgi:O-antigen ligase